jgi:hypothetical protein
MAHEYSVKIHNYITDKIVTAEKMKKTAEKKDDFKARKFYEGQLDELRYMREYLTKRTDLNTQKYY